LLLANYLIDDTQTAITDKNASYVPLSLPGRQTRICEFLGLFCVIVLADILRDRRHAIFG
jgi:hypothetical protein